VAKHSFYDHSKLWLENLVKPTMDNKPLVYTVVMILFGAGGYYVADDVYQTYFKAAEENVIELPQPVIRTPAQKDWSPVIDKKINDFETKHNRKHKQHEKLH